MKFKMRYLGYLALLLTSITAVVWVYYAYLRQPPEYITVTSGEIIRAVYATGTVEPVYWAALSPQQAGRLAAVVYDEGDKVTRGEVVARMESRAHEARLHEAEENLNYWRKETQRQRGLAEKGAVSRSRKEETERQYGEARERVSALRREVEDLKLVAPMDGVVLRRDVEPGETVLAGEPAFWVGSPEPLRITAEVDEEDISRVKTGQAALIKVDAFPDRVFEGKVTEITQQGDPVGKVFRVRISLPPDTPLLVNMTAEVNIITRRIADALVIPAASEAGGFVWRVEGRKKVKTPVKAGMRNDTHIQILEGIAEGDVILTLPPPSAREE